MPTGDHKLILLQADEKKNRGEKIFQSADWNKCRRNLDSTLNPTISIKDTREFETAIYGTKLRRIKRGLKRLTNRQPGSKRSAD